MVLIQLTSLMQIVNISVDGSALNIQADLLILVSLLLAGAIIYGIYHQHSSKHGMSHARAKLSELSLKIGGSTLTYNIERNYQNLEIAHRIYVELITRKGSIPFDEEHDVIAEVYDSWHTLFGVIRNEIKEISGETLYHEGECDELIRMGSDILNKGLRPHLTRYQARFRKWYGEEWDKSNGKSPQEIQQKYPDYERLVSDLKTANTYLIAYKDQLKMFIGNSRTDNAANIEK